MGLLDNAKAAFEIVKSLGNVELQQRLLDVQSDALRLLEENASLKGRIKELEEQDRISGALRFDRQRHCYWLRGEGHVDAPPTDDGPFCQTCWDVDRKLVRLVEDPDDATNRWCDYCVSHRGRRG